MMKLRILHIEDDPKDFELIRQKVKSEGIDCEALRVDTRKQVLDAVEQAKYDIILCDYTIPSYDGLSALREIRQRNVDIPFIFVSGTIGEVRAIEAMRLGATDYVLKTDLARLVPSIRRALREVEERLKRESAERALRIQSSYFQQLFENSPVGILMLNDHGGVVSANKSFQVLFQYSQVELKGREIQEFIMPADKSEDSTRFFGEVMADKVTYRELQCKRKNGAQVDVQAIGFPIVIDGRIVGMYGIFGDLTERKRLESKLLRSQRLESVGTLAHGIAHNLNNVLGTILMGTKILEERNSDPNNQRILTALESSTRRGTDIVKEVLAFARGVEVERMLLQPGNIIHEIESIVHETFPPSIRFVSNVSEDLRSINANPTQLHQVLLNLCLNARDAMPDGGTLSITAENVFLEEVDPWMAAGAQAGYYVLVTIADTGTGIVPEILDKIFDPFFTTKGVGKGTGLGLSSALGIVKGHGGFIDVYSDVGKGTQFKIYLPASNVEEKKSVELGEQYVPEWVFRQYF